MASRVNFSHPANSGILAYLASPDRVNRSLSSDCSPESISRPYETLGTHPDLVMRLWDEITVDLPDRCAWIAYGAPALVHPQSGVIFGYAGGTHTYALRLPPVEFQQAVELGAKRVYQYPHNAPIDLSAFGDGWIFCRFFKPEPRWCLSAYHFAASS